MASTTTGAALFPLEATPAEAQAAIKDEFAFFSDWAERYQYLIDLGRKLPAFPEEWKTEEFVFTYSDRSWTFTRSMIDADMECETKLDQAWNLGHIGSLSERKRQIDALARTPLNLTPTMIA